APVIMAKDQERLIALDWMRGLVMVLMALDHASMIYNSGRLALDSAATYAPGTPLPWAQFLTRWVTHLCAPRFVFLAGAALALSCHHRGASGHSERSMDRDMVIRGLIIASYDLVLRPFLTMQRPVLQVMFAIGMGMIAMVWLRRLNAVVLLSAAVLWFLVGEAVTTFWWDPASGNLPCGRRSP
ncbi:MAG: heparan-alpha-glucosaminide N-acetyltransferase domain-containing protein, partial [Gammaproteobacteria bacterium]